MNRWLMLILALAVLSACSTLPRKPISKTKQNADLLLQQAQRLELSRRLTDSIDGYESALRNYELIDDLEGQVISMVGIARNQLQLGFPGDFEQTRTDLAKLIELNSDLYDYHLKILDLYHLYHGQKWQDIRQLGIIESHYPDLAKIQILSYRVQADARLKQMNTEYIRQLERLTSLYHRRLRQNRPISPEIVSTGYYSLAYYHLVHSRPERARRHISKAREIDYTYEIYLNLAYDLWLEAKIAQATGNVKEMTGLLLRSRKIFAYFAEGAMLNAIDKDLAVAEKD